MSDLLVLRDLVSASRASAPKVSAPKPEAAAKPPEKPVAKPADDTVELPSAEARIASWAEASRNDPLVLRLAETARQMRAEYLATIRDLRDPLADWQIRAVRDKSNPGTISYELSRRSGAPGKALITPGPNGARDATIVISEYSPSLFRAAGFVLGALQNGRLAGL
ncbi:MAG: hypothetical protein ACK5U4_08695 [Rhodospirillales bacterium]